MPCPHHNVQQFTEICLDCGVNIYETAAERVSRLSQEVSHLRSRRLERRGDELEAERDRLKRELEPSDDDNNGGW